MQRWGEPRLTIKGISARQTGRLDRALIESELAPLAELKDDPEVVSRLLGILRGPE